MGFIFEPVEPGRDCGNCWDANKAPRQVLISIWGVQIGQAWLGQTPGVVSPNGNWILGEDEFSCTWAQRTTDWEVEFSVAGGRNTLSMNFWDNWGWGFSGLSDDPCQWYIESDQLDLPNEYYYGGYARMFMPNGDDLSSMSHVASLINLTKNKNSKSEAFGIDEDYAVARFANVAENTNIKIKLDMS